MIVGQASAQTSVDVLVERIAGGDRIAETEFVRRYQRGVLAMVRRHCRPGDPIVEDLVQDVLTNVLERLRSGAMRDAAALPAYIQTAVVHAAAAEYRRRRPSESVEMLDTQVGTTLPVERWSLGRTVHALLRELPVERDRELLRRFYLLEQTKNEVCSALGIEADHFHRVVFRARERFRVLLERVGIGEA